VLLAQQESMAIVSQLEMLLVYGIKEQVLSQLGEVLPKIIKVRELLRLVKVLVV
jgi:hypothetical protein